MRFRPALLPLCLAPFLVAMRPGNRGAQDTAAWLYITPSDRKADRYLEVVLDGTVVLRDETKSSVVTRRGKVPVTLAKDFLREVENSDVLNSQSMKDTKMVFYRGEIVKVSAYVNGELRRVEAPLNKFSEAFSYALGELKKAADRLPPEKKLSGFVTAELLTDAQREDFELKAGESQKTVIETHELQSVPQLMKAIKQPWRLIPLETQEQLKAVRDFATSRQLYGPRTLFHLPTTRGVFVCPVLEAAKETAVAPAAPLRKK